MKANVEVEQWYLNQILNGDISCINGEFFFKDKLINTGNVGGYQRCYLYPEGRGSTKAMQVHRLLWMYNNRQLIPDNIQINHEDGIKDSNSLDNFTLTTNQQNIQHAFDTGLAKRTPEANVKAVENNPLTVFSNEDVKTQRRMYSEKSVSVKQIADTFKCSTRTVYDMLNKKTYSHVP